MHRKRLWMFLPAVLALLLTACASSKTQDLTAGDVNNGILSDFTTTDLEGNSIDQTIFADYPLTMVNVWATFCTPCLNEMPDLGELAAEYESRGFNLWAWSPIRSVQTALWTRSRSSWPRRPWRKPAPPTAIFSPRRTSMVFCLRSTQCPPPFCGQPGQASGQHLYARHEPRGMGGRPGRDSGGTA